MPVARILLQCCTSAKLRVEHGETSEVRIGKGLIAYVAFLKTCSENDIPKIVDAICNTRLLAGADRTCSLVDLPGDLLLVPHFCLSGKLKQNVFQYHNAASKENSESLYNALITSCSSFLTSVPTWSESPSKFFHGTFAIRQDLLIESNGPFFHVVDL